MKLHQNQLDLILHLIWFNIMAYEDCLKFLDTENTGDMLAMSYVFRPLTKNKYVAKNKDGVVSVLKKGRALFPEEKPLISNATGTKSRERVLLVSRVGMWMVKNDIPVSAKLLDTEEPYFIPSACWRNIAKGILSTTRFAGMLVAYEKNYAVYDIGDGTMEWQIKAEASLFNYRIDPHADGMILICKDGIRNDIAKQIIRQTMWNRKRLLKTQYTYTDKPVAYSRARILLRVQYEHVYLTTPALLEISLERIYNEEYYIENGVEGGIRHDDPKFGDIEVWPRRYYLNPAFDVLKMVYFFARVKDHHEYLNSSTASYGKDLEHILVVWPEDEEVAKMYEDINEMKEAKILVYRSGKDTGNDPEGTS